MSTTPHARKDAARKYQEKHGGSYAAALAAVATTRGAADPVARAVRLFDDRTGQVIGQRRALAKLRVRLAAEISAGRRASTGTRRGVVQINAPRRGLWEGKISVAFAQAYMLGVAGEVPGEAHPEGGRPAAAGVVDFDRAVVLLPGASREPGAPAQLWLQDAKGAEGDLLIVECEVGEGGDHAIDLALLRPDDLASAVVEHFREHTGNAPEFTAADLRAVANWETIPDATRQDAATIVEHALAAAAIRSSVDDPGSAPGVTVTDIAVGAALLSDRIDIDAAIAASKLSRYGQRAMEGGDWATLMRVRDPGAVDPLETWSAITRYDDPRRLRIPIGVLSNGDRLDLDIKQAAEGGTGPHGQLLGATGSGKSEFLRNMILNACVTHSPEKLNWLLVDFKGGAAFLGMADLPHVTAVITNMEEEAHLVSRVREMIIGEIDRRLGILREANKLNPRYDVQDIGSYERLRESGVDLEPMPALVIVVDEFVELLAKAPAAGDVLERVTRLGRSVGIHLLFASQNLDASGRTTGLESNIGYKIGLKTQTPQESRALLNNSDAAFRLPGTPGHGILLPTSGPRVGENIQFYAGFTGAPYFPSGGDDAQHGGGQRPARTVFDTVAEQLRVAECPPPYRMWLPPLEVVTLDEVEPSLGRWAAPSSGVLPRLCVPMGLFDEPVKHAQPLWTVDTADQNVLIVGGAQLGKSTVVKTLVCSLALHNTPEQVQMYLVDYSGGGLGPLADLPHVGGFATRADPDGINRILSQMSTLIQDRAQVFRRHGIATMADYRRLRTDPRSPLHAEDKYGDVFIVIDGWDAATSEGQVLQYRGSEIEALIAGALNYGVHLVLATSRTVEMRGIEPHMKTVIELHTDEFSRVDSGLAKARRPDPGHVVTTRSSLQGLVALPRIDGCADRDSINAGMQALVDGVREEFANRAAERLRTLPTSLTYEQLAELVAAADQRAAQRGTADDPRRRLRIPFGIGEERLTPAYAEMWYEPHLLFLGQPKSGKSECLGAFYDAITRKFTGGVDEAAVIFYDPVRRHLGRLDEANLFAYVTTDEELAQATVDLDQRYDIQSRSLPADIDAETRAARSWWQGPEVFIIVDDEQFVGAQVLGEKPFIEQLAPWAFNEPLARGLHFVIARTTDDLGIASYRDQILKRMLSEMVPTVMLSAKKFDGQIGDQKFENFGIPGRGRYIQASQGRKERIQAAWSGHHYRGDSVHDLDA